MKSRDRFVSTTRWLLGALAALAFGSAPFSTARADAGAPSVPAGARLGSWRDNGQGGRYVLQLENGRALRAGDRVAGIVTSDTRCEPDAQGLSHCRNGIDLANGSRIVVIDTHAMMRNRCLAPGDRLSLTAVDSSWLVGTLAGK